MDLKREIGLRHRPYSTKMNGARDMGQKREVISRSGPLGRKRNDPYVSIYRNYSGFVPFEDCQSHQ